MRARLLSLLLLTRPFALQGRTYDCPRAMYGSSCMDGYDSHRAPGGWAVVLFRTQQVLPLLVITYSNQGRLSARERHSYQPDVYEGVMGGAAARR